MCALFAGFALANAWSKPTDRAASVLTRSREREESTPLKEEIGSLLSRALKAHGQRWPAAAYRSAVNGIASVVERFGYSPAFVLSLIQTESSFRLDAVSSVGALGLTQVMPSTAELTARRLGLPYHGPADLFDPATNIGLGFAYLDLMERQYGSIEAALVAYNCGPALVERNRNRHRLPRIPYRRDVWRAELTFAEWTRSS